MDFIDMLGAQSFQPGSKATICERCLLITESPKTPGHYRYLIWVLGKPPDYFLRSDKSNIIQ